MAWLEERHIYSPEVIVVPSAATKGNIAVGLNVQYSIDDKAGNAVYVQYHVPGIKSYIIDRKYNQFDAEVLGSKVKRVKAVDEFLDDIEKAALAGKTYGGTGHPS